MNKYKEQIKHRTWWASICVCVVHTSFPYIWILHNYDRMWASIDCTDKYCTEMDWIQIKEAWLSDWLTKRVSSVLCAWKLPKLKPFFKRIKKKGPNSMEATFKGVETAGDRRRRGQRNAHNWRIHSATLSPREIQRTRSGRRWESQTPWLMRQAL